MRRRFQHHAAAGSFEAINVTPLIDVVMCLVIFFLIVGKLAADASAVRLPESGFGRADRTDRAVVVAVAPALPGVPGAVDLGSGTRARIWIDGVAISGPNELAGAIRDRGARVLAALGRPEDALADLPVQVRADRSLPFAAVEPVLKACADLGITGVRLAAERNP